MSRYIDADKLAEGIKLSIRSWGRDCNSNAPKMVTAYQDVLYRVEAARTADVVEVRHGGWKDRYDEKYANRLYECSLCGEIAPEGTVYDELERPLRQQMLSPYCPNCGADMRGMNDGKE